MKKNPMGACGCGDVQYEITGPIRVIVNCHCNTCRKNNGTSYSTYCVISHDDLGYAKGKESVNAFDVFGGAKKHACNNCGSPLYNTHDRYPGMAMVYYGSFLNSENLTPNFNIYCENKLPWVDNISIIKGFKQSVER